MANRDQQGDPRDNERMGRGVHEGLNAGQSRNAHDSGSRSASGSDAASRDAQQSSSPDQQRADASRTAGESGRVQDDDDAGEGGYGNDTGFTGGTRGASDDDRTQKAAPGSSGARTEDTTRSGGVGKQASSGMDERESSGESR